MQIFDLGKTIQNYNWAHTKNIPATQTWGLMYLSTDGLTLLNEVPQLIDDIKWKKDFKYRASIIDNTDSYGKALLAFKHTKNNIESRSMKEVVPVAKCMISETRIKNLVELKLKEENDQHHDLCQEEKWQEFLSAKPEHEEFIINLKAFWRSQQKFSLATNAFLQKIYERVNDALWLLQDAEKELTDKWKRLPAEIADLYQAHLDILRGDLGTIKNELLETMYARLKVASEMHAITGNLQCDDVMAYIFSELQRIGLIDEEHKLSYWKDLLSAEHFSYFHEAIQHEGAETLKTCLLSLSWFSKETDSNDTVQFVKQEIKVGNLTHTYLAPAALQSFQSFGNRRRYEKFLIENQDVFTTLKLNCPLSPRTPLEHHKRFERLDVYQQQLENAIAETSKKLPPWWKFWQLPGRRMLKQWQNMLSVQMKKCHQKRFALIQEIVDDENAPADRNACFDLWLLLHKQLKICQCNVEQSQQQLSTLKADVKTKLKQTKELRTADLLQALIQNENLSKDEIIFLSEQALLAKNPNLGEQEKVVIDNLFKSLSLKLQKEECLAEEIIAAELQIIKILSGQDDQLQLRLQQFLLKIVDFQLTAWEEAEQVDLIKYYNSFLALQTMINRFGNERLKALFAALPSLSQDTCLAFARILQEKLPEVQAAIVSSTAAAAKEVVLEGNIPFKQSENIQPQFA